MKKILIAISAFSAIICSGTAYAQSTDELWMFANNNFGISSARTAAMGGAYTSLGADIASMSINPAGLGLYRAGEFSFSPQLRFSRDKTSYRGIGNSKGYNTEASKLVIGNMAAVFTSRNGFVYGFGYNRLADFQSESRVDGAPLANSITDMFVGQLGGIAPGNLTSSDAYYNYPLSIHGAILGYNSWALDHDPQGYFSTYHANSTINPSMVRVTEGALDEFAFSMAYNIEDKVYFGATLGIQSLVYNKFDNYFEQYSYVADNYMEDLEHVRKMYMTGAGVNLKIGMIVRPTNKIRIGISYHTPTAMSTQETSYEDMYTSFYANGTDYAQTPENRGDFSTSMVTPAKLLVGVSATVANRGIISVDYKRTWTDGMRFSTKGIHEGDFRAEVTSNAVDNFANYASYLGSNGRIDMNGLISEFYQPVSNYSVGGELYLGGGFYGRGGYMYQTSPYALNELQDFGTLSQISGGLGFRTYGISFDLTYVHSTTKLLPYQFFNNISYLDNLNNRVDVTPGGEVNTTRSVGNVIMSIGFRF